MPIYYNQLDCVNLQKEVEAVTIAQKDTESYYCLEVLVPMQICAKTEPCIIVKTTHVLLKF